WNLSKGFITFLDRYFDYIIRNYGVLMFKSNGNQGDSSEPYATSPGNGYNMICSGCYNDGNTVKWDDDQMASYSSWWNPAEGHEKPEVATPGDGVDTTGTSSPWIMTGFNGTSSASPLTMGVATLVANRAPALVTHPEAIKALLMVSAWHNIEGDATLSDKDGAGGVHAGAADAATRDHQYETGTFTNSSFPYEKTIPCYQGDGTRVICLWHSDPNSSYSTDVLKMDLDMVVLDPYNEVVASSASAKNPFEIVYFVPEFSGDYKVRLTKQSFLGTTEPYCIAWSTRQDASCGEISISGSGAIGTTVGYDFYNPYAHNESFIALLSLGSLPNLIPMGDGYILPVAWDSVAYACLIGAIPGFYGTLDSNGEASASVTIPHSAPLIGLTLYCAMVTYDEARLVPEDTSEASFILIN
ncbi:MAG: S8/S53 family peptidase, partial [Planctomycetota bacterium]